MKVSLRNKVLAAARPQVTVGSTFYGLPGAVSQAILHLTARSSLLPTSRARGTGTHAKSILNCSSHAVRVYIVRAIPTPLAACVEDFSAYRHP